MGVHRSIDFELAARDIGQMFIDYVEIEVAAGNGGHGCISFLREKFVPKGGPDGGKGGRGGNIVAVADGNLRTLLDYRYQRNYKAAHGQRGGGKLKSGKFGDDTILRLPVGTMVTDLDSGEQITDLDSPDMPVVLAKGGRGGYGNDHFKTPTNQTPRKAQDGQPGQVRRLALELKLLADVGLVGMPNAGKSTMLAAYSAARPKIADYPFTTLTPNLGIVKLREHKSCVMADIPGLIEGAAEGKGLGHQFLKHIQRTGLLLYVIDINDIDLTGQLEVLKKELHRFDPQLLKRKSLVVITKVDTFSESDLKEISKLHPDDYIYISAVAGMGADELKRQIERILDQQ